jgi:hypothetical protein
MVRVGTNQLSADAYQNKNSSRIPSNHIKQPHINHRTNFMMYLQVCHASLGKGFFFS